MKNRYQIFNKANHTHTVKIFCWTLIFISFSCTSIPCAVNELDHAVYCWELPYHPNKCNSVLGTAAFYTIAFQSQVSVSYPYYFFHFSIVVSNFIYLHLSTFCTCRSFALSVNVLFQVAIFPLKSCCNVINHYLQLIKMLFFVEEFQECMKNDLVFSNISWIQCTAKVFFLQSSWRSTTSL